jgi:NitT/TauT family transport system ATP-binding protein
MRDTDNSDVLLDQPALGQDGAEDMNAAKPWYLHFDDVSRTFATRRRGRLEEVEAVANISIGLRPREIVAVIGPSGCGKSTLLSLGAGLDMPSGGQVLIGGVPVTEPHPDVAFMLQKDLLLPWRSILHNVEFGLEIHRMPAALREALARDLLHRFGLEGFAGAYPHQLSGGMRQRAALARTMALRPPILLMDEPFSALDAQTKMHLQGELLAAVRGMDTTAMIITHDLTEAVVLADRIYVMSPRPGRIIAEMVIDLPAHDDATERYFDGRTSAYVKELWSLLASHSSIF